MTSASVAYQELMPAQVWAGGDAANGQPGSVTFHQETNLLINYNPVYCNNSNQEHHQANGQLDVGYNMWSFLNENQHGISDVSQSLPPLQLAPQHQGGQWPSQGSAHHPLLDQYGASNSNNHSPMLPSSSFGLRPPPPPYNTHVKANGPCAMPGPNMDGCPYGPNYLARKKPPNNPMNGANSTIRTNTSAGSILPEELCLVCGDKASGYHYNALTCEGCKGFFRRSITRKAVYYCKYGGQCDIDMYMRRKCQACRLRKCLDVGMRSELVIPEEQCRLKRESKIKLKSNCGPFPDIHSDLGSASGGSEERKSNSPQQVTSTENLSPDPTSAYLLPEQQELIHRILIYQQQTNSPNQEDLCKFVEPTLDILGKAEEKLFQRLTDLSVLNVRCLEEFVKYLPGFSTLCKNDQLMLLKACSTELLALRIAKKYDVRTDSIHLGTEKSCADSYKWGYSRQLYKRTPLNPCVDPIFEFAKSMARLKVDDAEFALLTAISLFSDRPGLTDPKKVEDIQEVYTSTLQAYVDVQRPRHRTVFARLLMKLTDLRSLGQQHAALLFDRNRGSKNGLDDATGSASCQRNVKSTGSSNRRASYAGPTSSEGGAGVVSAASSNSSVPTCNGGYRTPSVRIKVEPLRCGASPSLKPRFRPSSGPMDPHLAGTAQQPNFGSTSHHISSGSYGLAVNGSTNGCGSRAHNNIGFSNGPTAGTIRCGDFVHGSSTACSTTDNAGYRFSNGPSYNTNHSTVAVPCADFSSGTAYLTKMEPHPPLDQSVISAYGNSNLHFTYENRSIDPSDPALSSDDCNFVDFSKLNNANFFDSPRHC